MKLVSGIALSLLKVLAFQGIRDEEKAQSCGNLKAAAKRYD